MSTGGKSTAAVYLNCQWLLELGFRQGQDYTDREGVDDGAAPEDIR
jgi:hypothetical protein